MIFWKKKTEKQRNATQTEKSFTKVDPLENIFFFKCMNENFSSNEFFPSQICFN